MKALETLYTFELSVSDVEQGHYEDTRVQLPAHPEEPLEYTICRALAYAHCLSFQPKLEDGWYNLKKPTMSATDTIGEPHFWAHVGHVDKRLAKLAERQNGTSQVRFYFYNREQIDIFCHHLRGSKENWISPIQFFSFDGKLIGKLAELGLERRNIWQLNFLEGVLFLTSQDESLEGSFEALDMWQFYQESLIAAAG